MLRQLVPHPLLKLVNEIRTVGDINTPPLVFGAVIFVTIPGEHHLVLIFVALGAVVGFEDSGGNDIPVAHPRCIPGVRHDRRDAEQRRYHQKDAYDLSDSQKNADDQRMAGDFE